MDRLSGAFLICGIAPSYKALLLVLIKLYSAMSIQIIE